MERNGTVWDAAPRPPKPHAWEEIQVAELSGGHSSLSNLASSITVLSFEQYKVQSIRNPRARRRLIYGENIAGAAEYQRTSNKEASSAIAQITQRTARRFLRPERAYLAPLCAEVPGADETPRLVGDACSQSCGNRTGPSDFRGRACTALLGPTVGCSVAAAPSDACGGRRFADWRGGSAAMSWSAS